ncbi:MAG TPA: FtsX-like permease family protein [Luteitalea sp.]|nr:FtsX-like permease family protein [Luteitalea sp.]
MHLGPLVRAMLRNKVRFGLLAVEVALTLAIVANCVSLILEARRELTRPSGFVDEQLLLVTATPFNEAFREVAYRDTIVDQDLAALRAHPAIETATNSGFLPWQGGGSSTMYRRDSKAELVRTQIYAADEKLLDTLGVRLVEGRAFTREDVLRNTEQLRALNDTERQRDASGLAAVKVTVPAIISKAYAQLMFPEGQPLGKTFEDEDGDRWQVIGVIDTFYNPYAWKIGEYATFYPRRQGSYEGGTSYLVRVKPGQLTAVEKGVEGVLAGVNANRTYRVRTVPDVKRRFLGSQTLMVRLLSIVIVVLVFVTGLGIMGLTSFSVAERTRQIGTRRALGADRAAILKHFLLENWITTTVGIVLGVGLAITLNMTLLSEVDGPKITPGLLAIGAALLWLAGLLATLWPALRGARVAPAEATRNI